MYCISTNLRQQLKANVVIAFLDFVLNFLCCRSFPFDNNNNNNNRNTTTTTTISTTINTNDITIESLSGGTGRFISQREARRVVLCKKEEEEERMSKGIFHCAAHGLLANNR